MMDDQPERRWRREEEEEQQLTGNKRYTLASPCGRRRLPGKNRRYPKGPTHDHSGAFGWK